MRPAGRPPAAGAPVLAFALALAASGAATGRDRPPPPEDATHAARFPATRPAPSGAPGLAPVGDAAPRCRAGCAGVFYACRSGEGDACGVQLGVCRAACDTTSQEAGRLVSPLPAAGLGATEAFRRLSPPSLATAPPQ